jgi:hypothetical protein
MHEPKAGAQMKNALITTVGAAIGLVSLLAATSASAAERGFYVGAYYGQIDKDSVPDRFSDLVLGTYLFNAFEPLSSTGKFDSKDSSFGFFGGYRMSEYVAFEGGFMELGDVSYGDVTTGIDHRRDDFDENGEIDHSDDVIGTWNQQIRAETRAISLTALGIWPATYRSELFVKGGVLLSSARFKGRISDGNISAPLTSESKTSIDPVVGVGASYTFADIYAVRLEYQRIFDLGHEDVDEADADVISLGITVTF